MIDDNEHLNPFQKLLAVGLFCMLAALPWVYFGIHFHQEYGSLDAHGITIPVYLAECHVQDKHRTCTAQFKHGTVNYEVVALGNVPKKLGLTHARILPNSPDQPWFGGPFVSSKTAFEIALATAAVSLLIISIGFAGTQHLARKSSSSAEMDNGEVVDEDLVDDELPDE